VRHAGRRRKIVEEKKEIKKKMGEKSKFIIKSFQCL
jgi:hypothetical protein